MTDPADIRPTDQATNLTRPEEPSGPPAVRPRKSGGRWLNLLFGVAALVAVAGVAFAVGRSTAPVQATTGLPNGGLGTAGQVPTGSFAPGGGFGGAMVLSGTVASIDGSTLTLTTGDGQTVTVDLSASPTYHAQTAASAASVTPGTSTKITVAGGAGLPGGQGQPGASPGDAQSRTLTASDVTIVSE
jgi:hypothetical protein